MDTPGSRVAESKRPISSAIVCLLVAFSVVTAEAQAPKTISHQGVLKTNVGEPVADATYSVAFAIYDDPSGGSVLWHDTKNVQTSDGLFSTTLGPISNVDFNQLLWLGIQVESDAEMTPRTELTSVPSAFALVHPYLAYLDTTASMMQIENHGSGSAIAAYNRGTGNAGAFTIANASSDAAALYVETDGSGLGIHSIDPVKVETADLSLQASALQNDDLLIEANKAQIGVYSDETGMSGSGLQLGEVDGSGALIDKWAMVRSTSAENSDLRFTFGSDPDYDQNPARMKIDSTGDVTATGYNYASGQPHAVSFYHIAFRPSAFDSTVSWQRDHFLTGNVSEVFCPLHLPDDAVITKLSCFVFDGSAQNISCSLKKYATSETVLAGVVSSGTPGATTIVDASINDAVVDNLGASYFIEVESTGTWSIEGNSLRINRAWVEYTVTEAD